MKIKEWYYDNKGYDREQACVKALKEFYRKGNLVVTYGSGRNVNDIFGLPYTSSSEYAAIWNCQAEAHYKSDKNLMFEGVAITDNGDIVAVFSDKRDGLAEWTDIVIGRVEL